MRVITRAEARSEGAKRYYTGVPCRNGHLSERWILNGKCVACDAAKKSKRRRARGAANRPQAVGVRNIAFFAGETRYSTGIPCPKGHVAERMTSTGRCVICLRGENRKQKRAKEITDAFARDAAVAAKLLTETLGIPHVVVETVDPTTGKKTFQPQPKATK